MKKNILKAILVLSFCIGISAFLNAQDCHAPSNIIVADVNQSSITLRWDASSSNPTTYHVFCSATAYPTNDMPATAYKTVNDALTVLTGLTPLTTYYVFVRSACGENDYSDWSSPVCVTTTQVPATLPYIDDFTTNKFIFLNGDYINRWSYGSATGNPAKAIYISDDGGISNTYSNDFNSTVYAFRDIAIPNNASLANFSFDWRCAGEGWFSDYLKVWLVPATYLPMVGWEIMSGEGKIQIGGTFNQQTTWQTYQNNSLNISSFAGKIMRLVFEWSNDGSIVNNPPAAIDNVSLIIPSCMQTKKLLCNNVSLTSANIFWIASTSNPDTYQVYYFKTPTTPADDETQVITTTTNSIGLDGLDMGTEYYVWVRSACGENDYSVWIGPVSFITEQIPATLPYIDDFETNQYAFINGAQTNQWVYGSATGNPENAIYISNDGGINNAYTDSTASVVHAYRDIVIPSSISHVNFSFNWKCVGESFYDYFKVWMVPVTFEPTAGTEIGSGGGRVQIGGKFSNLQADWQTYQNLSLNVSSFSGQTMRLVFEWKNNGENGYNPPAAIDNVSVVVPSCFIPTNLGFNNVGVTSATILWNASASNPSAYHMYCSTTNTTPAEDIADTEYEIINENPYTLTGLSPNTTYYVWLRSGCGANDYSDWIGPVSFTTNQTPASFPYIDDFETNQYIFVNGTQTNQWAYGSAAGNPENAIYISNDGGINNAYSNNSTSVVHAYRDIAIPDNITFVNFSFDWKCVGEYTYDKFTVWIAPVTYSPTAGTTITTGENRIQIVHSLNHHTTWQTFQKTNFDLSSFAGQTIRLIFEWRNNDENGNNPPVAIDNVNLSMPSCVMPTNFVLNDVDVTSATISWDASPSNPNAYHVYCSTASTAPVNDITEIATSTSITLINLEANTTYYVWVRSDCEANGHSNWKGPIRFITAQIPANLPYVDDFETNHYTFINGTQTNKWTYGSATGNPEKAIYISNDNGESNAYTMTSSSTVHAYRDIAIPANTSFVNFSFDWKCAGDNPPAQRDCFRVWLVPITYIPNNLQILPADSRLQIGGNFTHQTTWQNYQNPALDLSSFAGQTVRLIFEWYNDHSGGNNPPAAIDNVSMVIPTCIPPFNILVSDISSTTATVTWIASNSNPDAYHVYYSKTTIESTDEIIDFEITNTNSITLNGIESNTEYYIWVRSDCGASNYSEWTEPVSFMTTQALATLPYIDDFETNQYVFVNGTDANKWVYGSAAGNPANAIYISYNGGVSNVYHCGTSKNVVHAYRDIAIPDNTSLVNFCFDWQFADQNLVDYFRVWMVPATYMPVAGTQITNEEGRIQIGGDFGRSITWQTYQKAGLDLSSFAGQTMRLVFEWTNGTSGWTSPSPVIDNVSLIIPTCFTPTNVEFSDVDQTSLTITWNASISNPDVYQVYYSTINTAPADNVTEYETTNTNSITLSGLEYNAVYYVWIRTDCEGGDYSIWNGPYRAGASCNIISEYPYFEGFNNNFDPHCWTIIDNDNNGKIWKPAPHYSSETEIPYEGEYMMISTFDASVTNDDWLISPQFKVTSNNLKFNFYAKSYNEFWPESFNVLISKSGTSIDDFTVVLDNIIDHPITWEKHEYILSDYDIELNDEIYIAIQHVSDNEYALYIDAFTVSEVINSEAEILSYSFAEQYSPAIIDDINKTITIKVNEGTDLSNLVATFTLSEGATAKINGLVQESGVTANDFTNPVVYTITYQDSLNTKRGIISKDWTVIVSVQSGIETAKNSAFAIYPNPNNGKFTLDFININGKVNYQIFDTKGSIILSENFVASGNTIKEVSLNLVPGVYFVKLVTETQSLVEKLVVE